MSFSLKPVCPLSHVLASWSMQLVCSLIHGSVQRPHGNSANICPSGHFSGWLFSSIPVYGFIFFSSAFSSVRKLSFPSLKRAVAHLQASLFPPFVSFPRHLGFEEGAEKEQIISSFMISKGKSRRLHKENWQDLKLFAFHTNQKFSGFFLFLKRTVK